MTQYEVYVFILCLIVFILLTTLSIVCITLITKMYLRLVRGGLEDEKLIKEHKKFLQRSCSKFSKAVDIAIAVFLCAILIFMFSGSIYINCTQNVYFDNVPTYRVVKTGSMAKKNKKNTYLVENGLDNQIQTFDLIATYKIPKEEDLKLYDIVVYEYDDMLIVHRIVGIEEPNERHPNERYFLLQGDAVDAPDRFPVLYSQMRGIYRGEKIPFVGSFVLFMQSPAGWLCILLVAITVFATPVLEKKIAKEKGLRLAIILSVEEEVVTAEESTEKLDDESVFARQSFDKLKGKKDERTLEEKLLELPETKARYDEVSALLSSIVGARVIEAKKYRTVKVKNTPVARLVVRGKTLNVYLAISPESLAGSKYKFTDHSNSSKFKNYPTRVKVTSDRQLRWTKELINRIIEENHLSVGACDEK